MLTKKLFSLQHPNLLRWNLLRTSREFREKEASVLITGEAVIRELQQKVEIKALISLEEKPHLDAIERYLVTEGMLKKITGLKAPDGLAAEVALPDPKKGCWGPRCLILDQISDPGNLGTLVRTAHALGWTHVVATPGTVDFFNDKALRASRGAMFKISYDLLTEEEIIFSLQKEKRGLFVADTQGENLKNAVYSPPLALVLSHESKGPSAWVSEIGKKIVIPMQPDAESLNVASAGAIFLYKMGLFV